jgi:hypothetical protein
MPKATFYLYMERFVLGKPADVDRAAIRAVLNRAVHKKIRPGRYRIRSAEGTEFELEAAGLNGDMEFTGCSFHLREMNWPTLEFILSFARAGDMIVLPAVEDFVPILSRPEQKVHLPEGIRESGPEPVLCETAGELEAALETGFNQWLRFKARPTT